MPGCAMRFDDMTLCRFGMMQRIMRCVQGQRARGAGAEAAQDQSKCPYARNRHSASILSNMIMNLVPCICPKDGAPIR
jgi:hypothetical protein